MLHVDIIDIALIYRGTDVHHHSREKTIISSNLYDSTLLSPSSKRQHNYINMGLINVNRQHNYVNMQHNLSGMLI